MSLTSGAPTVSVRPADDHPVVVTYAPRVFGVRAGLRDGLPVVESLTVARLDGQPLTVADLRSAPLARLARLAAPFVHGTDEPKDVFEMLAEASLEPSAHFGSDAHMREVAEYIGSIRGTATTADGRSAVREAVRDRFRHPKDGKRVSDSTADRWIRRAKQLGYLTTDLRKTGTTERNGK
jgi:hypothetical protein